MALATNLLRAYDFEGNSTDSVGGYNGTDNSVAYSLSYGKILQGVHFSGSGSYISAANTSLPTGASAFSVEVWIKTSTSGTQAIYGYGTVSSFGYRNCLLIVSNKLYFSGFGADLDSGFTVNDGNWHHCVVTYNGTTMSIYVDGLLKNSGSVSLNVQSGTSLYIGDEATLGTHYTGDMDMLRFWSRALSADEASQLFYSGKANAYPLTDTPPLYGGISYYKLDESSGNASDSINYKTLTNTSGTYGAGKINNGWNGSGSTTHLRNSSFSIGSQANFTVAFWFKTSSSTRGDLIDFNKADRSAAIQILANSYSAGDSAGRVGVNLYYSGATHWTDASTTGLNNGSWHHLAYTVSGSNTTIYIDGASAGTNTNGTAMYLDDLALMGDPANGVNYLNGSMDEVFICNRALSSTEIGYLYKSGNGNQYPFIFTTLIDILNSSTIADTLIKSTNKVLSESKTIADTLIRSITKLFTESSTESDTLIRSTTKTLSEADTISDNLTRQTSRTLSDSSTISDTFTSLKILFVLLIESITSTDIIQKITSKLLQETQTIADSISKGFILFLSEASTIVDSILKYKVTLIDLFEDVVFFEDFRLFLNGLEARWKNLFKSKSNSWDDKTSNKINNWIDKKGL